jgi:hypothetical protein
VIDASTVEPATQIPALVTSFCDWMRAQRGTADITLYLESAEFLRLSHGLILAFVSADPVLGNPIRLA